MLLRPKLKETEISFLLACLIITSQNSVEHQMARSVRFENVLIFQVNMKPSQEKDVLHHQTNHNRNQSQQPLRYKR